MNGSTHLILRNINILDMWL